VPPIPKDNQFDSSLAFFRDPYRYISKRCRELGTDVFQTRVALQSGICMMGAAAAEVFYDERRFKRRNVAPRRFQKTLFGVGGVQGLDGDDHRRRKQMFMSLMTEEQIRLIGELSVSEWEAHTSRWEKQAQVVLYKASCELLTRVACAWAGVPLDEADVSRRTHQLKAMFDYAGSIGPKHWWARVARRRAERWIGGVVEQSRAGKLNLSEQCATHVISHHRDLKGDLLPVHVAAVEILNVLRPIVAVAVYFTFAAHAMHQDSDCCEKLESGPDDYPHLFTQEVRRFYPFFPAVGAEVRQEFAWQGCTFPKGMPVLLDLYGTNHDQRSWADPESFRPERFREWDGSPFNFIPQGGGDHHVNHRCPGEWICIELVKVMATFFARRIRYKLPEQDLEIDFARVPALPRSHMILTNVTCRSSRFEQRR
jgi:fatty-acid peroxygenase